MGRKEISHQYSLQQVFLSRWMYQLGVDRHPLIESRFIMNFRVNPVN